MSEFEHFKQNLITYLGLSDAVEATWIKSKSKMAIPLLLTFRGNLPTYVTISGEQAKSKYMNISRSHWSPKNARLTTTEISTASGTWFAADAVNLTTQQKIATTPPSACIVEMAMRQEINNALRTSLNKNYSPSKIRKMYPVISSGHYQWKESTF